MYDDMMIFNDFIHIGTKSVSKVAAAKPKFSETLKQSCELDFLKDFVTDLRTEMPKAVLFLPGENK